MNNNNHINAPKDEYILTRDGQESLRLSAQHYVLIQRQGWFLHPTIATAIAKVPNPQIADAATGTGIWASEFATKHPSASVIGLDISPDQFPPKYLLPANVSLEVLDLLGDIPAPLRNKFDVVHIRLLSAAGPGLSKDKIFESVHRLLKPGGWLQWDDFSWPSAIGVGPPEPGGKIQVAPVSEDNPTLAMMAKYVQMRDKVAWFEQFEEVAASKGLFTSPLIYRAPVVPHLAPIETETALGAAVAMAETIISKANITDEATLQEIRNGTEHMRSQARAGNFVCYNWLVCTAQKAT